MSGVSYGTLTHSRHNARYRRAKLGHGIIRMYVHCYYAQRRLSDKHDLMPTTSQYRYSNNNYRNRHAAPQKRLAMARTRCQRITHFHFVVGPRSTSSPATSEKIFYCSYTSNSRDRFPPLFHYNSGTGGGPRTGRGTKGRPGETTNSAGRGVAPTGGVGIATVRSTARMTKCGHGVTIVRTGQAVQDEVDGVADVEHRLRRE